MICCSCQKHVCRNIKCADWLPKVAQWQCQLCHRSRANSTSSSTSMVQTSSWVADQLFLQQDRTLLSANPPNRARSEIFIAINDSHHSNSIRKSVKSWILLKIEEKLYFIKKNKFKKRYKNCVNCNFLLIFIWNLDFDSVSQTEETNSITAEQKVKIREYVEQVVAEILGENLDSTVIQQLSKSSNCE